MGAVPRGPLVENLLARCRPVVSACLQAAQLRRLPGVCVRLRVSAFRPASQGRDAGVLVVGVDGEVTTPGRTCWPFALAPASPAPGLGWGCLHPPLDCAVWSPGPSVRCHQTISRSPLSHCPLSTDTSCSRANGGGVGQWMAPHRGS